MRKTALIILYVLLFVNLAKTQIHTGVGGKVAIPTNFHDYTVNYGGIGLNITAGYLFKEKLDFTIGAENIWFNSSGTDLKTGSLQANVKYIIIKKPFKPYIGFGMGFFQTSYLWFPGVPKTKESGIGYVPAIGAWFDSEWLKGLFINPEFSYYYIHLPLPDRIYRPKSINPINFNIGLLYCFENKKKE
jgi:hypothetical protein